MEIIKSELLSRDMFCTGTFYWHRALVGLKIDILQSFGVKLPSTGRSNKLLFSIWLCCCLASCFLSVGFKFRERLQDLRNGGSTECHGRIRSQHHSCQCSLYLGGDTFSPCQRKSWVSFVQLPLLFHVSSHPP